jgi:hypothetical protein
MKKISQHNGAIQPFTMQQYSTYGNKSNKSKLHALGYERHIKYRVFLLPFSTESLSLELAIQKQRLKYRVNTKTLLDFKQL